MRITESQLRRLIREQLTGDASQYYDKEFPIRGWGKYFDSFHITKKYIGPSFTPRLQVPEYPYQDDHEFVIEDETTPRFLVAPNITGCFKAMESGQPAPDWHVYASKNTKTFIPNVGVDCPSSPDNPYGPDFSWTDYAEHNYINLDDDATRDDHIVNCVPDAKRTGEKWVTQETGLPVMMYLGKTISGDKMILSKTISQEELKQFIVMLDKTGKETM